MKALLFQLLACALGALSLGLSQPFVFSFLGERPPSYSEYLALLAFVGYVPLWVCTADAKPLKTFWLSLFHGTIQYALVLYWIYFALTVHGHISGWFSSIITLALALTLSTMVAVFLVIAKVISLRFSWSYCFWAPVGLCVAEFFRNYYIFGGFPWGQVGYSLGNLGVFLQLAAFVGVLGLVFYAGIVNGLFAYGVLLYKKKKKSYKKPIIFALVLIALGIVCGSLRYATHSIPKEPSMRVALLQGNIGQEIKSRAWEHESDIVSTYEKMLRRAVFQGADLIVWPESAYPHVLNQDKPNVTFNIWPLPAMVMGAVVYGQNPQSYRRHYHNSALVFSEEGRYQGRYDKVHLVPFGEYVPWPFDGIVKRIVPGMGAFLPGVSYDTHKVKLNEETSVSIGITICYEGIFPEITRAQAKDGASLLVNITNDAWYGISSAPYQHLLMYRLRAVESGRSVVRATNTGVSAWIDNLGNVHEATPLFEQAIVQASVPISTVETLYKAFGNVVPISLSFVLGIAWFFALVPWREFRKKKNRVQILLGCVGLLAIVAAQMYFSKEQFLVDESAKTKELVLSIYGFLVGIGALCNKPWGRRAIQGSGLSLIVVGVLFGIFEGPYFYLGVPLGFILFALGWKVPIGEESKRGLRKEH